MNEKQETEKKKYRINTLDVFIVLVVILCIVGVVLRNTAAARGAEEAYMDKNTDEYVISFLIENIIAAAESEFEQGTEVFLPDGKKLGDISGSVVSTPAEVYIVNNRGECVLTYSIDEGENGRRDLRGTIVVRGVYKEEQGFFLNGTTHLCANTKLDIQVQNVTTSLLVTDIAKVS